MQGPLYYDIKCTKLCIVDEGKASMEKKRKYNMKKRDDKLTIQV